MNWKSVFCLTILLAIALSVCAYGENTKNLAETKVAFPEPPKDGPPVSFVFLSMVGSGSGLRAKIRVFNHGDKDITTLRMTLNYLDDKGEKLKDFPWTQSGFPIAKKKSYADIKVGAFVPENTKKVDAIVKTVTFSSPQAATDGPPQDWDKLTLTSNYMSKKGLIYAFINKNEAKQERFTFGDLRKYINLGGLKDKNKTWTHQNERWVFKLESNLGDKEVVSYWVFVLRTSFNSGNSLILLDRIYSDNKLASDKETRQLLKSMLKDSLEE